MISIKNKIRQLFGKTGFESGTYWETRYSQGGNSGSGSYGHLAQFKAEVLNKFVAEKNIGSVIEFGCGDGNQLTMARYPKYIGLDVSRAIIKKCIEKFRNDSTKSFFLYDSECFFDNGQIFQHNLAMSLDVLYHLVEPEIYEKHLKHLFASSNKYVVIFSPNENLPRTSPHEAYRKFTDDVAKLAGNFKLIEVIKNKYNSPEYDGENRSGADFYFYEKQS
jgi:hypothetical protein